MTMTLETRTPAEIHDEIARRQERLKANEARLPELIRAAGRDFTPESPGLNGAGERLLRLETEINVDRAEIQRLREEELTAAEEAVAAQRKADAQDRMAELADAGPDRVGGLRDGAVQLLDALGALTDLAGDWGGARKRATGARGDLRGFLSRVAGIDTANNIAPMLPGLEDQLRKLLRHLPESN